MRAEVGDELTVKGRHQGDEERRGEIIRVDGADGARRTWSAGATGARPYSSRRPAPRSRIVQLRAPDRSAS
jgi:hypothetical protein